MLKKLTAKTQELNPAIPAASSATSKALIIKPESNEVLARKGSIYLVFDVEAGVGLDTTVITNIVHDTIYNSYYQSDNISPIQSLEKAIADTRDRVVQISSGNELNNITNVAFRILAGVLWGNVLYVVQYGDGHGFLVRAGQIRPVSTLSEGNFSAASGVIKEDDVIIMCTDKFGKKYPPEKLLSTSINEQELQPGESCLLLKFMVDTQFSEQELVNFGLEEAVIKAPKENALAKGFTSLIGNLRSKTKNKPDLGQHSISKMDNKIDTKGDNKTEKFSIADDSQTLKSFATSLKPNIKLKTSKSIKLVPTLFIPLVVIALIASIIFTIKKNKQAPAATNTAEEVKQATTTPEQPIEETDNEIFYDIKIADTSATPTKIAATQSYVAVADKNTGKLYFSNTDTPKFEQKGSAFLGIDNLDVFENEDTLNFVFTDTEGYKFFDPVGAKTTSQYNLTDKTALGGAADLYLDFAYIVQDQALIKYTRDGSTLTSETTWGESTDFKDAKSIAIAFSIYVLKQDGSVAQYSGGEKDNFSLDTKVGTLNNPTQIITSVDFTNLYIADTGNKRIVITDKEGVFVKEIKRDKWDNIKSIGVTPDEKILFVLNGSRVYKVGL